MPDFMLSAGDSIKLREFRNNFDRRVEVMYMDPVAVQIIRNLIGRGYLNKGAFHKLGFGLFQAGFRQKAHTNPLTAKGEAALI